MTYLWFDHNNLEIPSEYQQYSKTKIASFSGKFCIKKFCLKNKKFFSETFFPKKTFVLIPWMCRRKKNFKISSPVKNF